MPPDCKALLDRARSALTASRPHLSHAPILPVGKQKKGSRHQACRPMHQSPGRPHRGTFLELYLHESQPFPLSIVLLLMGQTLLNLLLTRPQRPRMPCTSLKMGVDIQAIRRREQKTIYANQIPYSTAEHLIETVRKAALQFLAERVECPYDIHNCLPCNIIPFKFTSKGLCR